MVGVGGDINELGVKRQDECVEVIGTFSFGAAVSLPCRGSFNYSS